MTEMTLADRVHLQNEDLRNENGALQLQLHLLNAEVNRLRWQDEDRCMTCDGARGQVKRLLVDVDLAAKDNTRLRAELTGLQKRDVFVGLAQKPSSKVLDLVVVQALNCDLEDLAVKCYVLGYQNAESAVVHSVVRVRTADLVEGALRDVMADLQPAPVEHGGTTNLIHK